ncbi:hypothetical protein [Dyella kyungheensis]|uniref:Uncharacterized protein n=1 Tax=Dyella kyungheensis TaxID=1242174 RepID=A0ABS2JXC0_9GAMM|nr:hypothetical protein [Dyella kyungheensis]MBM7123666.1 hypothetical protein [Dyella kyungheensis]
MPIHPPEFNTAATQLAPHLVDFPGKLIAIYGRCLAGKSTLGRFLAWYFNSSLIESDLYLIEGGGLSYHLDEIDRIIGRRLAKPRPVFIEGVAILKTLQLIGRKPDLLVYVTNLNNPGGDCFEDILLEYEAAFAPRSAANVVVELAHDG